MRARFLATAAAIAVASPTLAADFGGYVPPIDDPIYSPAPMAVVGHLEAGFGYISVDAGGDDGEAGLFQGAGRANIPFGTWNLEAEVTGGAAFDDGINGPDIGLYGHLWRGWGGVRAGVFGGVGYHHLTIGTVGLEGEAEFGALNLGGQASYNWSDGSIMGIDDAWNLRGWLDWYFNDNTKATGDVAYWNFDGGDLWSATLGFEHRFAQTPVSGFGELSYVDFDGADGWSAILGARLFIDNPGTTLRDHDRQVPFDYRFVPIVGDIFAFSPP